MVTGLAILAFGCASAVKRDDGSKVAQQKYVCGESARIGVSLHDNVAHLYQGMKRSELERQSMRDGMIIFSNDQAELAYKGTHPQLSLKGVLIGPCNPNP